jgi:hypothetical protein
MVYLSRLGPQDELLLGNVSYFQDSIIDEALSSSLSIEVPFDQGPGTQILTSRIPPRGDYISQITLKVQISNVTPTTQYFTYYSNAVSGNVYTDNTGLAVSVSSTTLNPNTYSISSWTYGSISVSPTTNKFSISFNVIGAGLINYLVFDSVQLANFLGFTNNGKKLMNGFIKFNASDLNITYTSGNIIGIVSSQVSLPECGWVPGPVYYGNTYSANAQTFFQSASLLVNGETIQEYPAPYIYYKQLSLSSSVNVPAIPIFEGDQNAIFENRTFYYRLPFIKKIPCKGPDVQVYLTTGSYPVLGVSMIIEYLTLEKPIPNVTHNIVVPQLGSKNPTRMLIGNFTQMDLNGEKLFGADEITLAPFENLYNPSAVSSLQNWYVFNNPINMSRVRAPVLYGNAYVESYNLLTIRNNLAGLRFNS